jgi:hypothetical protein
MNAHELAQVAYDRTETAETMYRYAFGLDHGDPDSLGSVFTDDAVLDFSAGGAKLGLEFPVLNGREAIVQTLISIIGPLDTTHTLSNIQVEISGETATLHAYMLAQHFPPGRGSQRGSDYALLMNRYDVELVRDGMKWRMRRVMIDNAWANGDPDILNATARHRAGRAQRRQGS